MPLRSRVSANRRSSSLPCFLRVASVSKMSISRAKCSGNFPESFSAQSEFETFISDSPPPCCAKKKQTHHRIRHRGWVGFASFDLFPATRSPHTTARLSGNNRYGRRIFSSDSYRYLYHSAVGEKVNPKNKILRRHAVNGAFIGRHNIPGIKPIPH